MSNRILLFGGTFDPVHHGHLIVARSAAEQLDARRIMLIPSARPPHKKPAFASPQDRIAMLNLAVRGDRTFGICDIEIKRGGESYTIDTLTQLHRELGEAELFWLIGADMLTELHKWVKADELVNLARFATAARAPYEDRLQEVFTELSRYFDSSVVEQLRSDMVNTPVVEIASRDIRSRVKEGKSIRYLTPLPVADFISANKLYL